MREAILFGAVPYLAVATMLVGVAWRLWKSPTREATSPQSPTEPAPWWRASAFRLLWIGIGATLAGHLLGLLLPHQLVLWNQHPVRLLVVEATGFALGILALVGLIAGLVRHRRAPGSLSAIDAMLLTLIAIEVLSGLGVALAYRWGTSWYAATFLPYLGSLMRLSPQPQLVTSMPFLAQLHVVGALFLLPVLPASSLGSWLPRRRLKTRDVLVADEEATAAR